MATLIYTTENKRIAMADKSSVTILPTEDTENERITLTSTDTPDTVFVTSGDGYYTIKDQPITEDYVDPSSLNVAVGEDGYASIPE